MLTAVLICWKPILSAAGNALVENDGLQKAQAAVVLGGDSNGVRILKAAQVAQAGYVPFVLVDSPTMLLGSESDMTILYAGKQGYPAGMFRPLLFPSGINSTRAEAQYVGRYLKREGISRILLVTSNYHTARAAYLFRKENPGLAVMAIPAADPDFDPHAWWTYRNGQKTFFLEWTKTITERWLGL